MGELTLARVASTPNFLGDMTTILTAYVGVIVLVVFLPFVATFILDGVVHVLRGRGLMPLIVGVVFTSAVAVFGVLYISLNEPDGGHPPATAAGMASIAGLLLPYSVGLALLAFLIRTVSDLLRSKKSRA